MRSLVSVMCLAVTIGCGTVYGRDGQSPSPQADKAPADTAKDASPTIVKGGRPVLPPGMNPGDVKGTVRLQLVLDPNGKVIAVTVVEKLDARLDAATVAAAKQWTYTGARYRGVPVYAIVYTATSF